MALKLLGNEEEKAFVPDEENMQTVFFGSIMLVNDITEEEAAETKDNVFVDVVFVSFCLVFRPLCSGLSDVGRGYHNSSWPP